MSDEGRTRDERIRERSAKRREARKTELRRAILDKAAELFTEQGFEGFSLRQVAEAIGYSPTTIYLYFEDKDELLFMVALDGFQRFGELLQAAYDGEDDPLARLAAIGTAYVEFGLDNPVHYRLMFMERGEFLERQPPAGYEPVIDSFGVLVRTVEECLAAGAIVEGEVMTYSGMIWAWVHGIVSLAIATPYFDAASAKALHHRSMEALVHGIEKRD